MLLRRLFHSSRHLRHGLQTLTTTTTATAASSSPLFAPLLFRRLPTALTSRLLSPRLLSTAGRDDDTNKPWAFTTESGDPDPFANEDTDAAATTGEVPLGSSAAVEDPWAKGFRAEDGEKGDVFEEIYKEEAASSPAPGKAAPAGDDELWTLGVEEEKDDPFAAAVLEEGIEGIGGEDGGLVELDAGGDEDAERQRQENKARVAQERLDFLYESGLAVGKGSSEGFQALQPSAPTGAASSSAQASAASSSKAAALGALFEDKPQSANDAWRKLHSDPLLLIRQREQDAIARIKNNPIKMAEIKKSVEAEKKQKEEKKEKRKHKKHRNQKSKSKTHHSNENSDSEEISDGKDERRKRVHSSPERKREDRRSRHDKKDRRQYSSDSEDDEPRRRRQELSDDEPRRRQHDKKDRRQDSSDSEDNVPRRRQQQLRDDEPRRRQHEISEDDEPRRKRQGMSKHDERSRRDHSDADDRKRRQYSQADCHHAYPKHDSSDSRPKRREDGRKSSNSERGSEDQRRQENQQGRNNGPTFNRRRGVHHMSEEEREARLRQMQTDAEVHEEQRWKRLKKAADDDAKEVATVNANQFRGKNFLEDEKKSIFGTEKGGSATIEESIRRRAYYSQGGRDAHESNAFRR